MTNNEVSGNNRRWYDTIHNMTQAVHITKDLPIEIQELIVQSLNEAIDGQRKSRRTDKYAISIGPGRVLGLHGASRGRRWYDGNAQTFRAFNFMAVVADAYLAAWASRILSVSSHVNSKNQSFLLPYERYQLVGQAPTILHQDRPLSIRQSDSGIRLIRDESRRASDSYKRDSF
jgi:hypothetical protein